MKFRCCTDRKNKGAVEDYILLLIVVLIIGVVVVFLFHTGIQKLIDEVLRPIIQR